MISASRIAVGCLAQARLGEVQEQQNRIAVGRDRAGAHGTLCEQVVGEELLDQRGETAGGALDALASVMPHLRASAKRSNRSAASAMSSGTAVRYQ